MNKKFLLILLFVLIPFLISCEDSMKSDVTEIISVDTTSEITYDISYEIPTKQYEFLVNNEDDYHVEEKIYRWIENEQVWRKANFDQAGDYKIEYEVFDSNDIDEYFRLRHIGTIKQYVTVIHTQAPIIQSSHSKITYTTNRYYSLLDGVEAYEYINGLKSSVFIECTVNGVEGCWNNLPLGLSVVIYSATSDNGMTTTYTEYVIREE